MFRHSEKALKSLLFLCATNAPCNQMAEDP